jgi:hypothetical protein
MMSEDVNSARGLIQAKHEFNTNHQKSLDGQQHRAMQADKANPLAHSLFTDLMRDVKRLHSHFTAIAYPVLNREGELRSSRWRGYSEAKTVTHSDSVDSEVTDNGSVESGLVAHHSVHSDGIDNAESEHEVVADDLVKAELEVKPS